MKIAIVEDETDFTNAYIRWIKEAEPDWEVDSYEDSSDATVAAILFNKYDLILLDILLEPDVTGGFRILRKMFEYYGSNSPGVIVLTGTCYPRDFEIMRALSVNEVSEKPTSADELLLLINSVRNALNSSASYFGEIELRPFKGFRNVIRKDKGASLTQSEIAILHDLLSSGKTPSSIEKLKKNLICGGNQAVVKAISEIRGKLAYLYPDADISSILVTNTGVGYSWHGL